MTGDVAQHYETLLAEHYTWMFGASFAEQTAQQTAILTELGIGACARRLVIDLGCGSGFQSVALAELGFERILAVDTSAALLAELKSHAKDRPIETIEADLTDLTSLVGTGEADAIVCMGDTLTHLKSVTDVERLFLSAHEALAPGGLLILTFRDLSTTLVGLERLIPIRADDGRVMTCFLEYEPDHVVVHDLIHVRDGAGWSFAKSCYRKLRLAPEDVEGVLIESGFEVRRSEPCGRLWAIAATARVQPLFEAADRTRTSDIRTTCR